MGTVCVIGVSTTTSGRSPSPLSTRARGFSRLRLRSSASTPDERFAFDAPAPRSDRIASHSDNELPAPAAARLARTAPPSSVKLAH